MSSFTFIDLFCGIGGFHQAMKSFGGECVFASDIDASCRQTYKQNFDMDVYGDITQIKSEEIPAHDVLCAGFPCQVFSKAGKRLGFSDRVKGTLFFDICRILEYHKPKFALLENVRNLASHDNGNTWKVIRESLDNLGYDLLPDPIIFSPHLIGIPQHRERVYIMCIRKDIGKINPFSADSYIRKDCDIESVLEREETIANLADYKLSSAQINLIDLWNEFLQNIKVDKLPGFPIWSEHLCMLDSSINLDALPKWKKRFILNNNLLYEANKDFIDSWLIRAKQNPLFFGAKAKLEWQAGQTDKPDIWQQIFQFRPSGIRVKVNSFYPALVAIVQTSVIGPHKRFLTERECARLQSFPEDFIINPSRQQAYKQFGNSVNIEVLKLFAKHMFESVRTLDIVI